jgi:hypothetical protein
MVSQVRSSGTLLPPLARLRQKYHEFEASLGYIVRLHLLKKENLTCSSEVKLMLHICEASGSIATHTHTHTHTHTIENPCCSHFIKESEKISSDLEINNCSINNQVMIGIGNIHRTKINE